MSGFENYPKELADLDHEIRHYAAICGVDLANRFEVEACRHSQHNGQHNGQPRDQARETLQGLLILRIKVETEMLEQGMTPPPLVSTPKEI